MVSKQLKRLANKYDWQLHQDQTGDSVFYGKFRGYLVTALEGEGFKAFFIPIAGISVQDLKQLRAWLEDKSQVLKLRNFQFTDNFLCIRLAEKWLPRSAESLEDALQKTCNRLDEVDLPTRACLICGQKASKKGLFVGLFCYLHPQCQDEPGFDFTNFERVESVPKATGPDDHILNELAASVQEYKAELVEGLIKICKIASVKGQAEEDALYGSETVKALNTYLELASKLGFETVNLANRAGYVQWGQGEKMVAALCHLDVVPGGSGWDIPPFEPAEIDGFITGRGTVDDKGPAMAILYALKALKDEGFEPAHRIRLIVGLDEENGSDCMRYYRENEELPLAGFTADASFPVIHAEKGIAQLLLTLEEKQDEADSLQLLTAKAGAAVNMVPGEFIATIEGHDDLVVKGKQAHASRPEQGENAIIKGLVSLQRLLHANGCHHPFISAFSMVFALNRPGKLLDFELEDEYGELTVNPGILDLEEDKAKLAIDIRYPVTCDFDKDVKKPLEKMAAQAGFSCNWDKHLLPLFLEPESDLIVTLNSVYEELTSSKAQPVAIGGGTYARAIPNIAAFGPTFPGDEDVTHQANERIKTDNLLAAMAIYKETFRALTSDKE